MNKTSYNTCSSVYDVINGPIYISIYIYIYIYNSCRHVKIDILTFNDITHNNMRDSLYLL